MREEESGSGASGGGAPADSPYATPRVVTDLSDCFFYHTVELPEYGVIEGEWDLRRGIRDYLGGVDVAGKRVLEIGTSSGFVCFHMESAGADVVAYDLSDAHMIDVVPNRCDLARFGREFKLHIRRLNNAYWLSHGANKSRARVVYGSVYDIPPAIGPVDISTFGCVLLHLRDPFLALQNALRLTRETAIITEPLWSADRFARYTTPCMEFLPDPNDTSPVVTWWFLSPAVVQKFLAMLGFEESSVTTSRHIYGGRVVYVFTVVAQRTQPL
jgi:hypothetical protein